MDFSEFRLWALTKRMEKVVDNLKNNGFSARFYTEVESGINDILKGIPQGSTIGIGGSVTIRELGLIDRLKTQGCEVVEHWARSEPRDDELRRKACSCQYYLSGTNAITEDGYLVNTDGVGNRIAALSYGPKNVYIVSGVNKVVKDLHQAIWRIKNIAAPANGRRVKAKTPCVETGICSDCSSPGRICRATLILERAPFRSNYQVIILNQILGL
ncbi:MAG TPA: lactate utilization protein [bacterium (Candidatus Stahlbacteria)]|nr:lactate utilization protein [Candidatus Stahlbacteria bacterium]